MYMTCRHIKTNGLPCESPALKGGQFCYYHSRLRTVRADVQSATLQLPPPEDPAAIQLSIARINEAILTCRLDLKKAAILLDAIRIAARFIDRERFFDVTKTVQSTEQNAEAELAPCNYVCEDDEDCNDCPYSDHCPRCISGDEDEDDDEDDEHNHRPAAVPEIVSEKSQAATISPSRTAGEL
jgi:hypothetical protein